MKLPKSIKIGGRYYKIILKEDSLAVSNVIGKIQTARNTLELQTVGVAIDEQEQEVALLHEVIHGILDNIGRSDLQQESFIEAFSECLYQVLKDNKLNFE